LSRPIFLSLSAGPDGRLEALAVPEVDSERYPDVWLFDLGLAKRIGLGGTRSLLLSAELFNVFNSNTVLKRYSQANADAFGRVDEILNPRVLRFGVRLTF
jgi:hypothetical protein